MTARPSAFSNRAGGCPLRAGRRGFETMATKKKKAKEPKLNTYRAGPDDKGFFGLFGGRYVAETLMPLILELDHAYEAAKADPAFHAELTHLNTHYAGRPSPLYFAERLTSIFVRFLRPPARGRRQGLLQARRAQPHRQPQDQQLPRPDPARQAHGQDAHHRRDRRRPARRRGGDRVRQVRACPARSSWAPSTSSARSPTCSA